MFKSQNVFIKLIGNYVLNLRVKIVDTHKDVGKILRFLIQAICTMSYCAYTGLKQNNY